LVSLHEDVATFPSSLHRSHPHVAVVGGSAHARTQNPAFRPENLIITSTQYDRRDTKRTQKTVTSQHTVNGPRVSRNGNSGIRYSEDYAI
jgi:hypothetical protein